MEYHVAFYAAAYLGIIAHWIERGCPRSSGDYGAHRHAPSFIKPGESIDFKLGESPMKKNTKNTVH